MVENLGKWPSERGQPAKVRSSEGCGRDAVSLVVMWWYDFTRIWMSSGECRFSLVQAPGRVRLNHGVAQDADKVVRLLSGGRQLLAFGNCRQNVVGHPGLFVMPLPLLYPVRKFRLEQLPAEFFVFAEQTYGRARNLEFSANRTVETVNLAKPRGGFGGRAATYRAGKVVQLSAPIDWKEASCASTRSVFDTSVVT